MESLATQTLVLFVIRTVGNPLHSRPSVALTLTTLTVVVVGVALPYTPLALSLGFTPLPGRYFVFLALVALTYLGFAEFVKRRLFQKHLVAEPPTDPSAGFGRADCPKCHRGPA